MATYRLTEGTLVVGSADADTDIAGRIAITSETTTPAQPTDGRGYLYSKSDGKIYWRSYDITETDLTAGGGSGAVSSVANGADDRIATFSGLSALNGEASLTFDGAKLSVQGGLIHKRRAVTSNTTVANDDYYLGVSVSSTVTITLPNASALTNGQTYVIKDEGGTLSDSVVINVTPPDGQTIDGAATVSLVSPYSAINIYTDGSTKYFIY
tara:strand:- start:251 stop:883 length:633 start_codon:yes stop_codon:yes gene_type:complete